MMNSTQPVQIVRHGELIPCKTAFIDAHTPGSNQKENFTIIGGGVSESPDQHVHIKDTPGFNIGAAGQPPRCTNSLHTHSTAEVFFVLKGHWRFFWGRHGDAGEVTLTEGDLINIPTGMFRGFENTGVDYGMIMAVLGGDDAGGGVVWAPEVIQQAREHGLILGDNGTLYDSTQGEQLPPGVQPMPLLNEQQLKELANPSAAEVVPSHVARYLDMLALSERAPARVLGTDAMLFDRPGFEIDFLGRHSIDDGPCRIEQHEVLMPMNGHWRINWQGQSAVLNPGDVCLVQPQISHSLAAAVTGEASLFRVRKTDDPAGATVCP